MLVCMSFEALKIGTEFHLVDDDRQLVKIGSDRYQDAATLEVFLASAVDADCPLDYKTLLGSPNY